MDAVIAAGDRIQSSPFECVSVTTILHPCLPQHTTNQVPSSRHRCLKSLGGTARAWGAA